MGEKTITVFDALHSVYWKMSKIVSALGAPEEDLKALGVILNQCDPGERFQEFGEKIIDFEFFGKNKKT